MSAEAALDLVGLSAGRLVLEVLHRVHRELGTSKVARARATERGLDVRLATEDRDAAALTYERAVALLEPREPVEPLQRDVR